MRCTGDAVLRKQALIELVCCSKLALCLLPCSLVVALVTIAEITSSHLGWPSLDGKFFLLVRVLKIPLLLLLSRSLSLSLSHGCVVVCA